MTTFMTTCWTVFQAFAQADDGGHLLFAAITLAALCGAGDRVVLWLTLLVHLLLIAL